MPVRDSTTPSAGLSPDWTWDQTEHVDFLHFNDVYHLNRVEAVSKFASILDKERHSLSADADDSAFVVFSGDAFSPSLESSIHHGMHMVPVLNMLNVDVACPGNHDFDFGEERLRTLVEASDFPWTLSNYTREQLPSRQQLSPPNIDSCLAGTRPYVVREKRGFRFGFFGLGGTDWRESTIGLPSQYHVEDPVHTARKMAYFLRTIQNCDFVIAITHMRLAEDLQVAASTVAHDHCHVDVLLGGHDHSVLCRLEDDEDCPDSERIWPGQSNADVVEYGRVAARYGRPRVVKSGSDFNSYSKVRFFVQRTDKGRPYLSYASVQQTLHLPDVTAFNTLRPNYDVQSYLADLGRKTSESIDRPVACLTTPLDGREAVVRQRDTNLGRFLCDVLKTQFTTDIALINAGSIRCDRTVGSKRFQLDTKLDMYVLTFGDVLDIVPFQDTFVVKHVTHDQLKNLLEVAVSSDWPNGRFLQSSGITYKVDRRLPVGCRVSDLRINHSSPFKHNHQVQQCQGGASRGEDIYSLVVPSFLATGHDGYGALLDLPTIDTEDSVKSQWTFAELLIDFLQNRRLHRHLRLPLRGQGLQQKSTRYSRLPVIPPSGTMSKHMANLRGCSARKGGRRFQLAVEAISERIDNTTVSANA